MPKTSVDQWDATASNNSDVGGVNIAEGCAPGNINDALRNIMAQIKAYDADIPRVDEAETVSGNWTYSGTTAFSGAVSFTSTVNLSGATVTFAAGEIGTNDIADLAVTNAKLADLGLQSFAGVVWTANKIPYTTGADTFSALNFRDEDTMSSNDAAGIPSQQSVKAYVDTSVSGLSSGWELVETLDSTDSSAGKIETSTFTSGYEYMLTFDDLLFSGDGVTSRNIKLEVYKADSAAWHTSDQNLGNASSSAGPCLRGNLYIPTATRDIQYHHLDCFVSLHNSAMAGDSGETSADLRRITWRMTAAEPIGKVRFGQGSWTVDTGGSVSVYRRKIT